MFVRASTEREEMGERKSERARGGEERERNRKIINDTK